EERLRTLGEMELRKRINAVVIYEAEIIDLENVPGLENKKIRFGDTIRIKDTKFNPPLYLEARIFNVKRDVFDLSKKTVQLGDFVEYTEEEVQAIWKQLQQQIQQKISAVQAEQMIEEYEERKKVESSTPPPIIEGVNPIWVDTSKTPHVPHVVIANEWVKMSPTEAQEVGAETPQGAQEKADTAEQNAKSYTDIIKSDLEDGIQQAQTTADGKNSVFTQPTAPSTTGRKIGDIWFDTSRDNLMHRFNGQQWVEAKWGEQSIVANSITANHIKSLVGLNVNDQFIVDSNGNVKFTGHLEGATGVFSGEIKTKKLRVRADSVHDFYDFGIEIETAQWQPDLDNPFVRTGYISLNTKNDALEIYRIDNNGNYRPLQGFLVEAERVWFIGEMRTDGNITTTHSVIIESAGYSYLRPNNPNNELRVANSQGQWSTVRAYTASPSSEKWKSDIKDVDFSAIEVLKQSKIYSYIRDGKKEREIGFVLERETPEILKDGEGVNSYSHSSLNTLAIQELIKRTEEIEKRLERLENEGNSV